MTVNSKGVHIADILDAGKMPQWKIELEQIKHRKPNLQVAAHMEQERRDALREHGDRVRFETIGDTSIGK